MKIALAQLNYTVGDFDSNKIKIIDCVTRAKAERSDLLVFCEQAISGAPAYDLLNKVNFLDLCEDTLIEIASYCDGISVLVGMPAQSTDNRTISVAVLIEDRKIKRYIGKKTVTSRDELFHFSPSQGCEYVRIRGVKVAVVVGRDVRGRFEYGDNADLIVNLANSRYTRGIVERRYEMYRRIAYQTGKPIVYVNNLGGSTDALYDGSSGVFSGRGEAIALLKNFEEDFQVIDISMDHRPLEIPYQNKTVNVYRAIKLGLGDYFRKNNFSSALVAVSGGIDSSVVAALATETLGADRVKLLYMPSKYTLAESEKDVRELAVNLGVEVFTLPIEGIYDTYAGVLRAEFGETPFEITEENIQARIRSNMTMAISNKFGHIVLNTNNKSSIAVGYSTLYGDTVGAISIIGDLYKTEVFDLARHIGRNGEIIPKNVILKAPSAELRPDQKDSDTLPPYDILDAILYRMFEEGQSREEIINAGFEAEDVYAVYEMVVRNEYKRYQSCPILRLSACTLRFNRIMPLTNRYGY